MCTESSGLTLCENGNNDLKQLKKKKRKKSVFAIWGKVKKISYWIWLDDNTLPRQQQQQHRLKEEEKKKVNKNFVDLVAPIQ